MMRRSGWFRVHRFSALQIQRMMDAIERSVVAPQIEIVEQRAARRQVLRNSSPWHPCQNNMDPVITSAHVDRARRRGLRCGINGATCPHCCGQIDSDIAIGCGRIACGSLPSTSVTLLELSHHSESDRFRGFSIFPGRHMRAVVEALVDLGCGIHS